VKNVLPVEAVAAEITVAVAAAVAVVIKKFEI
jgi:hypothetical protein